MAGAEIWRRKERNGSIGWLKGGDGSCRCLVRCVRRRRLWRLFVSARNRVAALSINPVMAVAYQWHRNKAAAKEENTASPRIKTERNIQWRHQRRLGGLGAGIGIGGWRRGSARWPVMSGNVWLSGVAGHRSGWLKMAASASIWRGAYGIENGGEKLAVKASQRGG
jgi:hypothetical protein